VSEQRWSRENDKLISPRGITVAVFKRPSTIGLNDQEKRESHQAMTKVQRKIIDFLNSLPEEKDL